MKTVAVIGLGRVGLPLALYLSTKACKVYGIDTDKTKIKQLLKGTMPFREEGAEKILKKQVNKHFFPSTSFSALGKSRVIIITLGTPVDENMNPDYDQLDAALESCRSYFKNNQLIILRSTLPPKGSVYIKEIIESNTKLTVGHNVWLAYCPERIAEGRSLKEIKEIPQIIGGVDSISTKKAQDFFRSIGIRTLPTDSISAELAKLFGNMYRYISFAIANEFMVIAESHKRNMGEIVRLVNQGYKRGGLALPGLTGGPCLYKDGFFLINNTSYLDLIAASWKINESVPLFLVQKLTEQMNLKDKQVTILGLAFKPEIDDSRQSLSFKIRKALLQEGAHVRLHDPFVVSSQKIEVLKDFVGSIKNAHAVIIAVRHNVYTKEKNKVLHVLDKNTLICDVWNMYKMNKLFFHVSEVLKSKNEI